MKRIIAVFVVLWIIGLLAPTAASSQTSHLSTAPFGSDLMVHIEDPPIGTVYEGGYGLNVPAGVKWCLKTVAFHLSTGASPIRRTGKFVLRDLNDTEGNVGRTYVVLTDNLRDWVYVDFGLGVGYQFSMQSIGPRGIGNRWITNMNGPLPENFCAPEGFGWATWFGAFQLDDALSEFWAVVEEVPA